MSDDHQLGPEPLVHPGCDLRDSTVGAWTELGSGTQLIESTFGDYSYTAGPADIIYTDIGRFCSIAAQVRINPGNHPMDRVTQHHCTYRRRRFGFATSDDEAFFAWRRGHRCRIGHDVWIGHNATIMPGVSIGDGAVIGAGAIVTRDIPAYAIAVGVPARPIRSRFPAETSAALQRIAWWNWDRATLEARFDQLDDVAAFVAAYDPGPDGEAQPALD